jgi:hypothetical protein
MLVFLGFFSACESDDEAMDDVLDKNDPSQSDFRDLLINQIDQIIIPAMDNYQASMAELKLATESFTSNTDAQQLSNLRLAFQEAYLSYQAAAVHNYFATQNQSLVATTNLFPVDTTALEGFVDNRSYNFTTAAQQRANGFPALDYLLYGSSNTLTQFSTDSNRLDFLNELVSFMSDKSINLANSWKGNLRDNFIDNGGTQLGSSISVQLNESLIYYEVHIRENKVGIPIGRLGPNDSPIAPDASKIEAFYIAQAMGNEDFTLSLVQSAVEEMERIYLGEGNSNSEGQGYDDLLRVRNQTAVDNDIKAQFASIYQEIANRSSISGNDQLYLKVQALVTLYKSDLLPILNVQDADGANDGD